MAAEPGLRSESAVTIWMSASQVGPFILVGELGSSHYLQGFTERTGKRKIWVIGGDLGILRHAILAHLVDKGIYVNHPTGKNGRLVSPERDRSKLKLGGRDFQVAIRMIITDASSNFHSESDEGERDLFGPHL